MTREVFYMAYTKTQWVPRQGTGINKFIKTQETPTSVTLVNAPDEITVPGTPLSAENLNHMEQGIYEAHTRLDRLSAHADMVDGMGRDLRLVFGIASTNPAVYIPQIMAEIRRRCNNNGEIDNTIIPDFRGLEVGDYIDGLDLSGIVAPTGGTAPQAWNSTYKNNRIVIAGFNTYKGAGDTENSKNHIVFVFRNVIVKGRVNATNNNAGGYPASEIRQWLEGAEGDGSGPFAAGLKAALAGGGPENYLYTIRKAHSTKSNQAWNSFTAWLPSELEVEGYPTYGDEGVYIAAIASGPASRAGWNTNVQLPIYQKSYSYRIKRFNGSRTWSWLMTPTAHTASYFCAIINGGDFNGNNASHANGGISPAICVA
jgi:hypothetical protein